LEALTYQDPDEAPFDEDELSSLDIMRTVNPSRYRVGKALVLAHGHFGCGLSCYHTTNPAGFVGSLDAVEEHERTCGELVYLLPDHLWRDPSDPEVMA